MQYVAVEGRSERVALTGTANEIPPFVTQLDSIQVKLLIAQKNEHRQGGHLGTLCIIFGWDLVRAPPSIG